MRPYAPGDRRWAEGLLEESMGSARVARLGQVLDPTGLPGLVAERGRERIGLLTYIVDGDQLEVLTLHCRVENAGAGSALLAAAAELAGGLGCRRLWLLTSNDNLHALGFYQRRGLRLRAVHAGALDRDRALKPEIPQVNPDNAIPLRDLLELELPLRVPRPAGVAANALVSIQYHALQAGYTYGKYLEDAEGHADVQEFVRQCQQEDAQRAVRCHELLAQLTKGGIG